MSYCTRTRTTKDSRGGLQRVMAIKDDAENLAEKNPLVDAEQLEEAQRQLDEVRKAGLSRPQYLIEPPYGGRSRRTRETESAKPRGRSGR